METDHGQENPLEIQKLIPTAVSQPKPTNKSIYGVIGQQRGPSSVAGLGCSGLELGSRSPDGTLSFLSPEP